MERPPAQGGDGGLATPNPGYRFVATVFVVTDTGSAQTSDDANGDASVIGSDDQSYSPDFDDVTECTNFNDGEYQLSPGQSLTGCVVFQLPTSVTVAQVQWSPDIFANSFGYWTV